MRTSFVSAVAASVVTLAAPGDADRSDRDYAELLRLYARGERAAAVAALGRWPYADVARQLRVVRRAARAAERCPSCPSALDMLPLRAAVMLHTDRDRADRPPSSSNEQPRECPGQHAEVAGAYASLLALREGTRDFARRFLLAMAERCQWDFCLDAALQWSGEGLARFPRDPDLLHTAGSVHEEAATIFSALNTPRSALRARPGQGDAEVERERRRRLELARRFLADAVAADAEEIPTRVRLGRVLWRLGNRDGARAMFDSVIERGGEPEQLYLARLFLGRVHEDAGRAEEAAREYEIALAIDPSAQAAAIALSHLRRVSGDAAGARRVLEEALAHARRRPALDAFWQYVAGNAASAEERFDELRRETLE